jgi:hypothetical protein
MKILKLICLLFIIALVGCNKKSSDKNLIHAEATNPQKRKIADYSSDSTNLGNKLVKPGYFEIYKEKLFVVDFDSMKVYKKDLSHGKFKQICGGLGRGPDEFVRIAQFHVYDHRIYVIDENLRKLNIYNLKGRLINTYTGKNYRLHRFRLINKKLALSFAGPAKQYRLQKINLRNGQILERYFPKKKKANPLVYEGQLGLDKYGNFYFVGFSDPVILSWNKKGTKRYAIQAVNYYDSRANYVQMKPNSSQIVSRFSPYAQFYASDLAVKNGEIYVLTGREKNKYIDIYNSSNGIYEKSFKVKANTENMFVDNKNLYLMEEFGTYVQLETIKL